MIEREDICIFDRELQSMDDLSDQAILQKLQSMGAPIEGIIYRSLEPHWRMISTYDRMNGLTRFSFLKDAWAP